MSFKKTRFCWAALACPLVPLLLLVHHHAAAAPPIAAAEDSLATVSRAACEPLGQSTHFAFHSDPWINLHHFLFQWAFAETERRPDDYRPVLDMPEREQARDLNEQERAAWSRAVALYSNQLVARNLTFDPELVKISHQLVKVSCSGGSALSGIPADLRHTLEETMPIYQRHWWSVHHAANVAWIRELEPELASFEARLSDQLAHAYGGQWPAGRIRVDVTAYANHTKGYTTSDPDHITLTSTDPNKKGFVGLEVLLHEASHTTGLEDPFQAQLDAAFARRGEKPPEGLCHVIQFFTPAKLLGTLLQERGVKTYESFAERAGLYQRVRSWDGFRAILERHWSPFLAGKVERAAALDQIARELSQSDKTESDRPFTGASPP
jgi:hypothetical protein